MLFGLVFVLGVFVGALVILGIEVFVFLAIIERLSRKNPRLESQNDQLDYNQSLDFSLSKQGVVWVLLSSKVPKDWLENCKASREQKRKKEFYEVTPAKKQAKINGSTLILTESDGSKSTVKLNGCIVEAVSASHLSSRKWAKRFPIKLENKESPIYKECKALYIFLETSWEKEAWCKALRLASSDGGSILEWSVKLQKEFRNYLTDLNAKYSSFMKPPAGLYAAELVDRSQRNDGSSSKVRTLWKKIAKKASKGDVENKSSWPSLNYVEKKINEKSPLYQDSASSTSSLKSAPPAESVRRSVEDADMSFPKLSYSGSQSSHLSDAELDERFGIDEGTLCWNLVISRLFFDSKRNDQMKRSLQARIQRTMSNMRTPSYIREVICTDIDIGNIPPYIHSMRVLPMDTSEVWAFEIDVEYAGGVVLGIETRLEVHELDPERTVADSKPESSSVEDVSSELIEGFNEYLGKQLDFAEGTVEGSEHKEEGNPNIDRLKSLKNTLPATSYRSKWKSIIQNIAKQVSQVPISLTVKVESLRGTLRLHIKPPPSDQLWFGFTSMPDIEFSLDSAVGDRKFTNGKIALFIITRLKGAINETLVLPNCECVGIPFMLADKNDWIPRKVAPFIWVNRESPDDSANSHDVLINHLCEEKTKAEVNREVVKAVSESRAVVNRTLEELRTPLLGTNDEAQSSESHKTGDVAESRSNSRSAVVSDKQPDDVKEDDGKPKKVSTRERMLGFGKKMGDKFEEKRRHLEEKSKQIVEKMRGP